MRLVKHSLLLRRGAESASAREAETDRQTGASERETRERAGKSKRANAALTVSQIETNTNITRERARAGGRNSGSERKRGITGRSDEEVELVFGAMLLTLSVIFDCHACRTAVNTIQ